MVEFRIAIGIESPAEWTTSCLVIPKRGVEEGHDDQSSVDNPLPSVRRNQKTPSEDDVVDREVRDRAEERDRIPLAQRHRVQALNRAPRQPWKLLAESGSTICLLQEHQVGAARGERRGVVEAGLGRDEAHHDAR